MLLMISSARAIERRFGLDAGAGVFGKLREVEEQLSTGPASARLLFPDDRDSMAQLGLLPVGLRSWASVSAALQRIVDQLKPDAILILGGDGIIPFCRLGNPIQDRLCDPDTEVPSDNPYGFGLAAKSSTDADEFLRPPVPVGRIPDPEPPDAAVFLQCLTNFSRPRPQGRSGIFAVVDPAWEDSAWKVLASSAKISAENGSPAYSSDLIATMRSGPPWSARDPEWSRVDAALLYFNLHGRDDAPTWRGFQGTTGRWVDVLSPSQVLPSQADGAVVVAENCYGAVVDGRSITQSMALAFLNSGARAFVGATGLAWGSYLPAGYANLKGADQFTSTLVGQLLAGETVGKALKEARKSLSADNNAQVKTLLQFVLYGNPEARL